MKKIFLVLLALGILASCKDNDNPDPAPVDYTWEEPWPNELTDSTLGKVIDSCKRIDRSVVVTANAPFVRCAVIHNGKKYNVSVLCLRDTTIFGDKYILLRDTGKFFPITWGKNYINKGGDPIIRTGWIDWP